MSRLTNWTLLISSENIATGIFMSTAIFFAIDSTKAVFPMAGRAAIIIRSDFCQPDVSLSNLGKPLLRPLNPSLLAAAFCSMS